MCSVTYECISIAGADPDVACDNLDLVSFDPLYGNLLLTTNDVVKYSPGSYTVTIRATTGSLVPITTDIFLPLDLVNPCTTATLENLLTMPFLDTEYVLGSEPITQGPYLIQESITIDTYAKCGPIVVEFIDQNSEPLDPSLFSVETTEAGSTFVVLQQS